ncbi:hypothetical protein QFC22_005296 [Naganishia vaughanmartiniae]|uniref:Uncharacterized protein n=1 Tax=Naganishia vaughanmartiniae TaxID=1424756 RepID=A0ACC2WVQ0_9TREE|nr:hypothetical protein QFC22_005296 [Naganishia vaughanmartiniae]
MSYRTKPRASDILPESSTEMLEMLLAAVDRDIGSGNDTANAEGDIGSWQSTTTANEIASPDSARDGTTTLHQIIQAIRDAQQSSLSSPRDPNGMRTSPVNSSTEEGPLYRPFRTPSSSSFMQGVDTPDRSPSVNSGTPLSTRNASALGFPPESPHSAPPALVVAGTEPDPSWMDFAQSGFGGDGSKLPKKPFVLGEAFKEAPQMAKASPPTQKPGSQTLATLGIGRPGQRASRKSGPQRSYALKSAGVTRLRPAFFEFERDARRIPRATEGWPSFMAIPLDKSVIRQFSLRSRYLLVLVDVVEPQQPDVPPVPIEKDQDSAIRQLPSPLQTPPPPPPSQIALAAYPSPPADDSDKRNRRRSFFRSFSGGSNKNRRSISSPLSSPSLPNPRMTESPLPPVAEKREPPLPSTKPTESPLLTTATAVPSPPRGGLLEPYRPNHSRSTSSVHRKPAPVLDQNELRELERSESRTRTSNDMREPDTSATVPLRTAVVSDDNVEVIRTDSLGSTSSTKNDSDSPKSLPRRRRSMAPSPASIGDARQVDDGVPTDALNKLALDDEVQGESGAKESDDTVTGCLSSDGPALVVEPDGTDNEIREIGEPELRTGGKGGVESATSQAPVLLGPVL